MNLGIGTRRKRRRFVVVLVVIRRRHEKKRKEKKRMKKKERGERGEGREWWRKRWKKCGEICGMRMVSGKKSAVKKSNEPRGVRV